MSTALPSTTILLVSFVIALTAGHSLTTQSADDSQQTLEETPAAIAAIRCKLMHDYGESIYSVRCFVCVYVFNPTSCGIACLMNSITACLEVDHVYYYYKILCLKCYAKIGCKAWHMYI